MKRLMWGERVIGEYPDDWEPPEGCDLYEGLQDGSMTFIENLEWPDPFKDRERQ